MLLVNLTYRELRVAQKDGTYQQFRDGKLEVPETITYPDPETGEDKTIDNPYYEPMLAFAKSDPLTAIIVNSTTCPHCAEVFVGQAAKAQLGKHRKDAHFELWIADKAKDDQAAVNKLLKQRANFVCDVCVPLQEYPTEADLAFHVNLIHASAVPAMDEAGNTLGGEDERRPGERTPTPAES